jgi:Tfp pilus assembly protein PilZ
MPKTMTDTRKYLRIPISVPMHGHLKFASEIKDVSIAGCFVETRASLSQGMELEVEFTLSNTARMIRVKGEVIWSGLYSAGRTGQFHGVGIQFIELRSGDVAILTEFIESRASQMRKFERFNISIPVLYSRELEAPTLEGQAVDISLGGLFIRAEQLPELDQLLRMEFSLPGGDPIRCSARVAYVNQDIPDTFEGMIHSGMGVEFIEITDDDLEKIDRILQNPLQIEPEKKTG